MASIGSWNARFRYDVTVLEGGTASNTGQVGIGVGSSLFLDQPEQLSPCTQRPGSIVFFGDGVVWCGAAILFGSQRFGAGDHVTVAVDADKGVVILAVNGELVKLQLRDMCPERSVSSTLETIHPHAHTLHSTTIAATANGHESTAHSEFMRCAAAVPMSMLGCEMRPFICVKKLGSANNRAEQCLVNFSASTLSEALDEAGFVALADWHTSNIRSLHSSSRRLNLSIDMPDCCTDTERMAWESFFLSVGGAKAHHHTCSSRRWWNALSEGECSICTISVT